MLEISKRRSHDDEVVEDSEPERQVKRQKTREQTRLARKKKCSILHLQQADQLDRDAIELTDTECNPYGPISVTVRTQSPVDKPVSGEPIFPVSHAWRSRFLSYQLQSADEAAFISGAGSHGPSCR